MVMAATLGGNRDEQQNVSQRCGALLFVSLWSASSVLAQPTPMTWPEAVAPLAQGRAKAEVCVSVLKRYGKDPQIERGRLAYSVAKSEYDAVIAGLITALALGSTRQAYRPCKAI